MTEKPNQDQLYKLIGEILETLRFRGAIFFHSAMSTPWGVEFAPMDVPRFHIALAGGFVVGADTGESTQVAPGEIAMLPRGCSHWIADQPGRSLVEAQMAAEACELNNPLFQHGEISHRLLCGMVQFDRETNHPLLSSLPAILHLDQGDIGECAWRTAQLIDFEISRSTFKGNPIVDRLTEVMFIQLLAGHVMQNEGQVGFFAAMHDPRLLHALELIHNSPEIDWTVESLGKQIGMSRSTLNRHFQQTMGATPMEYVQNWRLMRAYKLVKHTSMGIELIADQVGYSSSRTLSRAFERAFQSTPTQIRRDLSINANIEFGG